MDMKTLAGTLAYSSMCYLMAYHIYQEIYENNFRGNLNGMTIVNTFNLKRNQLLHSDYLYTSID